MAYKSDKRSKPLMVLRLSVVFRKGHGSRKIPAVGGFLDKPPQGLVFILRGESMSMGGHVLSELLMDTCQASPELPVCKFIELFGVILPYLLIIIFGLTFYKIVIEPEGKLLAKIFNAMPLLLITGGLPLLVLGQQLGLLFFVGLAWLLFGDSIIQTFTHGFYSNFRDILPSSKALKTILFILALPILFVLLLVIVALIAL